LQVVIDYATGLKDVGGCMGSGKGPFVTCEIDDGRPKQKPGGCFGTGKRELHEIGTWIQTPPAVHYQADQKSNPVWDHSDLLKIDVMSQARLLFKVQRQDFALPGLGDGKKVIAEVPVRFDELRARLHDHGALDAQLQLGAPAEKSHLHVMIIECKNGQRIGEKFDCTTHAFTAKVEAIGYLDQDALPGSKTILAYIRPDYQSILKKGERLVIAPECDSKVEVVRSMNDHRDARGGRFVIPLPIDLPLKLRHGKGTTLAIKARPDCCERFCNCKGCLAELQRGCRTCCLNFRQCCIVDYWMCCICCLECGNTARMCWLWCTGKQSLRSLRRVCARKCNLPFDPAVSDTEGDTACCCIPLRTAVFVLSLWTTFVAFCYVVLPKSMNADKSFTGGYDMKSRVIVGLVQLTGLFFGPIGCVGALELRISLLTAYNLFQMTRLFAMFFLLFCDVPLLRDCDVWRTDLNQAIKKHGWNPSMYEVAMANKCLEVQIDFVIGLTLFMFVYTYNISLTRRLIWDIEDTPKYLLAMPRDVPSGAFLMYSRTQGKSKPPYGALDGTDQGESLVGQPTRVGKGALGYKY
jgi:hypothetical protein